MAACYAPNAHFSDPVFVDLNGPEVGSMWRMLTGRATDLEVVHSNVTSDADTGAAHWDADYTFSTGRKVHNPIDATFRFENGLIVDHRDRFDLYAWSRQALGPLGLLFGWTPVIHNKIRTQARQGLEEFMSADSAPAAS
jgi:SnoaL-like domain